MESPEERFYQVLKEVILSNLSAVGIHGRNKQNRPRKWYHVDQSRRVHAFIGLVLVILLFVDCILQRSAGEDCETFCNRFNGGCFAGLFLLFDQVVTIVYSHIRGTYLESEWIFKVISLLRLAQITSYSDYTEPSRQNKRWCTLTYRKQANETSSWIWWPTILLLKDDLIAVKQGATAPTDLTISGMMHTLDESSFQSVSQFKQSSPSDQHKFKFSRNEPVVLSNRSNNFGSIETSIPGSWLFLCKVGNEPARQVITQFMTTTLLKSHGQEKLLARHKLVARKIVDFIILALCLLGLIGNTAQYFFYQKHDLYHFIVVRQVYVLLLFPMLIIVFVHDLVVLIATYRVQACLELPLDNRYEQKAWFWMPMSLIRPCQRAIRRYKFLKRCSKAKDWREELEHFNVFNRTSSDQESDVKQRGRYIYMSGIWRLFETFTELTVLCCLDDLVLLEAEPCPKELLLFDREGKLRILDLKKNNAGMLELEDNSWLKVQSSLRLLGTLLQAVIGHQLISVQRTFSSLSTRQGMSTKNTVLATIGPRRPCLQGLCEASQQCYGSVLIRHLSSLTLRYHSRLSRQVVVHSFRYLVLPETSSSEAPAESDPMADEFWWSVNSGIPVVHGVITETATKGLRSLRSGRPYSKETGGIKSSRKLSLIMWGDSGSVGATCSEYWNGDFISPLTDSQKHVIFDLHTNWKNESYDSFSLAYCPVTQGESLALPLQTDHFQHPVDTLIVSSPSRVGTQSLEDSPSRSLEREEDAQNDTSSTRHERQSILKDYLKRNKVYIGSIASQRLPCKGVLSLIERCDRAGIRFVHFSSLSLAKAKVVSGVLGLETDWNSSISLKPTYVSERFDWYSKAKLPKGLDEIREHLLKVDDVPLRVSSFSDSTPASMRGMMQIMKDHGERIGCVGSALCIDHSLSFLRSEVAIGLINRKSYDKSCSVELLAGSVAGIGADLLLLDQDIDVKEVIYTSRRLLANFKQALFVGAIVHLTLVLVLVLSSFLTLRLSFHSVHLIWQCWLFIPLYVSYTYTPAQVDIEEVMPAKIDADYQKSFRASARRTLLYLFLQSFLSAVTVILLTILAVANSRSFPVTYFAWINSEDYKQNRKPAAEAFAYFSLVWIQLWTSFPYKHRYQSILVGKPNYFWCTVCVVILVVQAIYGEIMVNVVTRKQEDKFLAWVTEPGLAAWILFFTAPVVIVLFAEMLKRKERKINQRETARLRVLFETKLGMYSPK